MSEQMVVLRSDSGQVFEVPKDRLNPWHTVYIGSKSFRMAHPISCDLTTCDFNSKAEGWENPPAPIGSVIRWGPMFDDWEIQEGTE